VFCNTLLALLWPIVAWIPTSALLFCPVPANSCHQLSGRRLLSFSACLMNVCASTALTALWFHYSPFTRMMWLRNSLPSLWYHSEKSKLKPFFAFRAHLWAFLEPILCKTCDSLT
jgi:hypothetical protein